MQKRATHRRSFSVGCHFRKSSLLTKYSMTNAAGFSPFHSFGVGTARLFLHRMRRAHITMKKFFLTILRTYIGMQKFLLT